MTRRTAYSPAIDVMIDGFDGADPWGSAMGMAFALADVCEALQLTTARDVLNYRPSPYVDTPDIDELAGEHHDDCDVTFEAHVLAAAYLAGDVTETDLIRACHVLDRYLDRCKRAGLDY